MGDGVPSWSWGSGSSLWWFEPYKNCKLERNSLGMELCPRAGYTFSKQSQSHNKALISFNLYIYNLFLFIRVHCSCLQTHTRRVSASDPITDDHESQCGCWELNSGSLEEQSVLFNHWAIAPPFFTFIDMCFGEQCGSQRTHGRVNPFLPSCVSRI